ncbi:hypothetical protein BH10PSE18_BH10PSE18_17580 [soil metagenome]
MGEIEIGNLVTGAEAGSSISGTESISRFFQGVLMNHLRTFIGGAISLAGVVILVAGRL